jgi:hypothetical protein
VAERDASVSTTAATELTCPTCGSKKITQGNFGTAMCERGHSWIYDLKRRNEHAVSIHLKPKEKWD